MIGVSNAEVGKIIYHLQQNRIIKDLINEIHISESTLIGGEKHFSGKIITKWGKHLYTDEGIFKGVHYTLEELQEDLKKNIIEVVTDEHTDKH